MWDESLVELFLKGGPVMWPLLICSVFAVALILDRSLVFLWSGTGYSRLVRRLEKKVRAGRIVEARSELADSRSPVARVAAAWLEHANSPASLREEVVGREASLQLARLERRLHWLALLAQVTPLLGLLGTVIGLMVMFHQMDLKGSQVQSADLAVGVWQKLLNTAFGMMIAIPCLVVFYWLDNGVGRVTQEMEWITSYLAEWVSHTPKSSAGHDSSISGNGSEHEAHSPHAARPHAGGGSS